MALAFAGTAAILASCTSTETTPPLSLAGSSSSAATPTSTNEYFSEAAYGVKASPRVILADARSRLPFGGGRALVGDAYKVKGRWYRPSDVSHYSKVGTASWYGNEFQGRLTANGEVYDMNRLTAAHPTLPLPCYARVTNLENGSSVVVRVNDRGPFANGRLIDLSREAAELLDYKDDGVAKVKVDYVGPAPLEGNDQQYLMASYRPGKDTEPGFNAGVMLAMNGSTPTSGARHAPAFPGVLRAGFFPSPPRPVGAQSASVPAPAVIPAVVTPNDPVLPDVGPIAPERPVTTASAGAAASPFMLAYANERVSEASKAFAAVDHSGMTANEVVDAWKHEHDAAADGPAVASGEYIMAATFTSMAKAQALSAQLAAFGRTTIQNDGDSHSVLLHADGRMPMDDMLRMAWANGAPDAMVVHD